MERTIIENGIVNIPSGNVWISEMELLGLFGGDIPDTPILHQKLYTRAEH